MKFYASEIQNPYTDKIEWKRVKQINNIEYIPEHTTKSATFSSKICVWQAWKVSPGQLYRSSDLEQTVKISPLNRFYSINESTSWISDSFKKTGTITLFVLRKL